MSNKVFISYASKDQVTADKIVGEIERRGIPCWISKRDIPLGADFQQSIVAAVQSAGAFLLLFSENANNSLEIPRELALAGKYKKVIIPARVQDILPSGAFEYQVTSAQFVDLFRDFDANLAALCRRLAQLLEMDAAVAERLKLEDQKRAKDARRRRFAHRIKKSLVGLAVVIGVAIALAVAGYGWRHRSSFHFATSQVRDEKIAAGNGNGGETAVGQGTASPVMGHTRDDNTAGPVVSLPSSAANDTSAAAAGLSRMPTPASPVLAVAAVGSASSAPLSAATDTDVSQILRAEISRRGASATVYAPGTYASVDGTKYVLSGPGVSLSDRTAWSLQRELDPNKQPFTAAWNTGAAAGNPDLANTNAAHLLPGIEYGIAEDNGRHVLVAVRLMGNSVMISVYGDVNSPPTQPDKVLTLQRIP